MCENHTITSAHCALLAKAHAPPKLQCTPRDGRITFVLGSITIEIVQGVVMESDGVAVEAVPDDVRKHRGSEETVDHLKVAAGRHGLLDLVTL